MTDKYHLDQPLAITIVPSSGNAVGNLYVYMSLFSLILVWAQLATRGFAAQILIYPTRSLTESRAKRDCLQSVSSASPPSGFIVAVLFDINIALWCNDNIWLIYLLWKALINTLFAFCWLVEALHRHAAVALVTSCTPINWVYSKWSADHESQF